MTLPVPLFYLHNVLFVNLWWPPRYNWNIVESGGNTANLTLNINQSINQSRSTLIASICWHL